MKTIEQAARDSGISKKLITAMVRQTGKENMRDICNHGADAGYKGLIYYSDTVSFFKRHKTEIMKLAEEQANDFGLSDAFTMIMGFNCLRGSVTVAEVAEAVYRGKGEMAVQVQNALTWYVAEEVARAICE